MQVAGGSPTISSMRSGRHELAYRLAWAVALLLCTVLVTELSTSLAYR
jgi:hypothetical protein